MKRFAKRAFIWSGVTVLILAGTAAASYLWILPAVVSSSWANNIVTKETNKFLKVIQIFITILKFLKRRVKVDQKKKKFLVG